MITESNLLRLLAGLAFALSASTAQAIISGGGDGTSETSDFSLVVENVLEPFVGVWLPGDPDPIPVERDPDAGPWIKNLYGVDGADLEASEGQLFALVEEITIAGTLAWSDWHEVILTAGWEFVAQVVSNGSFFSTSFGISDGGGGFNILDEGIVTATTVDFFFDPLFPGTDVYGVQTLLQFVGTDAGDSSETFTGQFLEIRQYPTIPEPTTFALLGLGLAGIGYRRRRLKKA